MAALENRADAGRELLAAVAALLEAVALDTLWVLLARLGADTSQRVDAIRRAAVRANRTVRPDNAFKLRRRLPLSLRSLVSS